MYIKFHLDDTKTEKAFRFLLVQNSGPFLAMKLTKFQIPALGTLGEGLINMHAKYEKASPKTLEAFDFFPKS